MSAVRTFRSTPFGPPGVSQQSLGIPAAAFPGRVATNSDLIVAVDRQQTTLLLPLTATAISMTVLDPSMIVAYSLLSIDNEIVKTTGPAAGNVIPVSRGFDGTVPAVHLANALVSGLIDAYHHNSLVAEVEAIETFIGPNGVNIGGAPPYIVSEPFNFAPQAPGGSLAAGNNSITLSPVPKGVNGTDQNHYLYISGGAGAAEPVLITGGSAVSGAASGQININCANAHSGAWTIKSATAGIQEAINTLSGVSGGMVVVSSGTHTIYATIAISFNGVWLRGVGRDATTLNTSYTGGPIISMPVNVDGTYLTDFTITGPGPTTGTNFAISAVNQSQLRIFSLNIYGVANGISFTGAANTQDNIVRDTSILNFGGDGIFINSGPASAVLQRVSIGGNAGANTVGIHVLNTVGFNVHSCYISYCAIGVDIVPGAAQTVGAVVAEDLYIDGYNANASIGLNIGGAGQSQMLKFTDCQAWGFNSYGIAIAGDVDGAVFIGCKAGSNGINGYWLTGGKNLCFIGCVATGNSAASVGNQPGMLIGTSNVQVIGGTYAQADRTANNQKWGIYITGPTLTNILIDGAAVTPNVTAGIGGQITALVGSKVVNCTGYNPVGQSVISVGASPFTYTSGVTPETVYIYGGTVSNVKVGTIQVASSSPAQVALAPNTPVTVTYTAAPSMVKDIQ